MKDDIYISGSRIELTARISSRLQIEGKVILTLDRDGFEDSDPDCGRNIVAYSETGEFLWKIEYSGRDYPDHSGVVAPIGYFDAYQDKGKLMTRDFLGYTYEIGPDDGTVKEVGHSMY